MSLLPEEHPFSPGLQGFLNILEVNLGIANDPKRSLEQAKDLSKECMICAPKLVDCHSPYAYAERMMLSNWSEALNSAVKITQIDPTSFDAMAARSLLEMNDLVQAKNVAIELSKAEHIRPQIKQLSLGVLAYLAIEGGDIICVKSNF